VCEWTLNSLFLTNRRKWKALSDRIFWCNNIYIYNTIIKVRDNNDNERLQGSILLLKIHISMQKNFSIIYPQFRHTLSKMFTSTSLHVYANSIRQNPRSYPCPAFSKPLLCGGLSKINFHFGKSIMEHSVAYFPQHILANKFSFFKNYHKFSNLLFVHKNSNNVNVKMLIWHKFLWLHYLNIHHITFPYTS